MVHKRWKIYGNPLDRAEFVFLRKREHKLEAECYNSFISLAEDKINSCPSHFWSFMKSKFPTNSIPDQMSYNGETSKDGNTISNFLMIILTLFLLPTLLVMSTVLFLLKAKHSLIYVLLILQRMAFMNF